MKVKHKKRSSLQIALRTNWDSAAGLKRPRETDWALQLNHFIGEAIMKVAKDHLSKLLSERAAHISPTCSPNELRTYEGVR